MFVRHTVYRVGRPLAVAKVPQQEVEVAEGLVFLDDVEQFVTDRSGDFDRDFSFFHLKFFRFCRLHGVVFLVEFFLEQAGLEADVGDKFPVVVVHGLLPAGAQGQHFVNDLPDFGWVFKRSFATGNIFFGSHNLFPLVHEKRMNKSIK